MMDKSYKTGNIKSTTGSEKKARKHASITITQKNLAAEV
jgi:hypothetical protein